MRIEETRVFKKDLKRVGLSVELVHMLYLLIKRETLPSSACDHRLKGAFKEFRECHVKPDLLLIYRHVGGILELVRLGSHSDIFKA
ncbi:type II toxin-antitoxin system YafQ family toxin [Helicobacter labacensis]|uniref:type II toxin-antitoxin system YafQ family toxin n=1 Tax=Helicobacter labacensis TaxID=2316079 RepID=UPI000EB16F2D|nr:type II toxin-antitoxin system YafQ family toxin [Helicobacter labacensis]